MNRKIKFRGKRIDNGEWIYGGYHKHIKRTLCPVGDKIRPDDIAVLIIEDGYSDWNLPRPIVGQEVEPNTVGQYTGKKDKNGKEIYIGDIVKRKANGTIIGIVEWNKKYDKLDIRIITVDGKKSRQKNNAFYLWLDNTEVIGNIFENPELLESEEN